MANDDDTLSAPAFPVNERAEDALWLAELIRGVRRLAENAGQSEAAHILDQARIAAQAAAGIPGDMSLN